MDRGRANVYLSKDVLNWYDGQAKKAGVSRSSYMAMALQIYMEQRKSLDFVDKLPELLEKIERAERAER